jgi:hypothetical protein
MFDIEKSLVFYYASVQFSGLSANGIGEIFPIPRSSSRAEAVTSFDNQYHITLSTLLLVVQRLNIH